MKLERVAALASIISSRASQNSASRETLVFLPAIMSEYFVPDVFFTSRAPVASLRTELQTERPDGGCSRSGEAARLDDLFASRESKTDRTVWRPASGLKAALLCKISLGFPRKNLPPRSYLTIINPRQRSAGLFQGAAVFRADDIEHAAEETWTAQAAAPAVFSAGQPRPAAPPPGPCAGGCGEIAVAPNAGAGQV